MIGLAVSLFLDLCLGGLYFVGFDLGLMCYYIVLDFEFVVFIFRLYSFVGCGCCLVCVLNLGGFLELCFADGLI